MNVMACEEREPLFEAKAKLIRILAWSLIPPEPSEGSQPHAGGTEQALPCSRDPLLEVMVSVDRTQHRRKETLSAGL